MVLIFLVLAALAVNYLGAFCKFTEIGDDEYMSRREFLMDIIPFHWAWNFAKRMKE